MAIVKQDDYYGKVKKASTESETLRNAQGAVGGGAKQDTAVQAVNPAVARVSSPAAVSKGTGMAASPMEAMSMQASGSTAARAPYSYSGVRPSYVSPYSTQIDDLLDAVMSREDFSYDLESDPLYDQYRKQYTREGDRAMRDAMGNAAALTGGYGSSYATTAGSQAYDYYLSQLNDRIPELEQLAYQKYLQEGQDLYDQLAALQSLEQDAYGKYRDSVSDFESDRAFDYGVYSDDLAQQNWQTSFDYQKAQDALAQQNWEKEFAYQQEQDALAYALKLAKQQSGYSGGGGDDDDDGSKGEMVTPPTYGETDNYTTNNAYYQIENAMHRMRDLEGATEGEMAREFANILDVYSRKGYDFDPNDIMEQAKRYGIYEELTEIL